MSALNFREYKSRIEDLREQIARYQELLDDSTNKLKVILEEELTGLMEENSIENIEVDGMRFSYHNELYISLRADTKYEGIKWLKSNSSSDKITDQVIVDTSNPDELIQELKGKDNVLGCTYDSKIHWKTLQSIARSLLEEGIQMPTEYFSVYHKAIVRIK